MNEKAVKKRGYRGPQVSCLELRDCLQSPSC
jgi:hypothetical protein